MWTRNIRLNSFTFHPYTGNLLMQNRFPWAVTRVDGWVMFNMVYEQSFRNCSFKSIFIFRTLKYVVLEDAAWIAGLCFLMLRWSVILLCSLWQIIRVHTSNEMEILCLTKNVLIFWYFNIHSFTGDTKHYTWMESHNLLTPIVITWYSTQSLDKAKMKKYLSHCFICFFFSIGYLMTLSLLRL
jgi:hypothetical protein